MAEQIVIMGECPHHGVVRVMVFSDNTNPANNSGNMCVVCITEFLKEHITQVSNVRTVQVQAP